MLFYDVVCWFMVLYDVLFCFMFFFNQNRTEPPIFFHIRAVLCGSVIYLDVVVCCLHPL
jgi:hypothetical protein